jgi:hypothetical protein
LSKDRSKDIRKEIKALRQEFGSRLERLEQAAGLSEPHPKKGASVQEIEVPEAGARRATPAAVPAAALSTGGHGTAHSMQVVLSPLVDLSLARAVESSLKESDGVEDARLRSLSGDAAVIDAKVAPGVSVVSALRQKLPIAFDVTDSTSDSVTIRLARPADAAGSASATSHEIDA